MRFTFHDRNLTCKPSINFGQYTLYSLIPAVSSNKNILSLVFVDITSLHRMAKKWYICFNLNMIFLLTGIKILVTKVIYCCITIVYHNCFTGLYVTKSETNWLLQWLSWPNIVSTDYCCTTVILLYYFA